MGKRLNHNFLEIYKELDRDCCEKFGVTSGGVTEYINRLNNTRFAPDRDDVLPRLVRYRNIRNKFAHDVASIRKSDEISKADIRWFCAASRQQIKAAFLFLPEIQRSAQELPLPENRIFLFLTAILQ